MGLFNKLFANKNNTTYSNEEIISTTEKMELIDDVDSKVKCKNCGALVELDVNYCWKCGNKMNNETKEESKIDEENKETLPEKIEYQYPDIELIKDETLKNSIKNIPDLGILNVPIGLDKDNNWIYYDITKMPNLLIGGTVMSGKTNMINSIILSLITKYSIEDVRMVIADSKGVDYSCYNGVPHLLIPVIRSVITLQSMLKREIYEMENRYDLLNAHELKIISDYNKLDDVTKVPNHLIFIDDYTVFANENASECNKCIERLARSGWNVGIYLIIVANHPTVDVLTAISQLNFPTRISFRVPSIKDSRMVLEAPGAEKISGIGNALINSPLVSRIEQIHTNLIDDNDLSIILNDLIKKNKAKYIVMDLEPSTKSVDIATVHGDYEEPLYDEIVDFVMEQGKASTSLLQRRFRLGYNRAAHVIDLLEANGVIGPNNGSDSREVLISLNDE